MGYWLGCVCDVRILIRYTKIGSPLLSVQLSANDSITKQSITFLAIIHL